MSKTQLKTIELVFDRKNPDPEMIKSLKITFPNQDDRLWIKARFWYLLGKRIGVVFHYD